MPFARAIILVLALTHAVGIADLVLADDCEEACSDDGCTDCMPGVACRCHCPSTMQATDVSLVPVKLVPPAKRVVASLTERVHASPDPREILHVPKRAA